MLRIAVCDDEQSYLQDVERLLDEYGTQRGIELLASVFHLPFDLAERVEKNADFDLYLLDIYMPGMTGITLAQQIRRVGIQAPIIFLTTSREHALEAFGVGAAGYLIKPFEYGAFFKMLDSVMALYEGQCRRSVLLKTDGEVHSVAVRDILYSEAHKNNQQIYFADGRSIQVRMTVSELFSLFAPSGSFVRCGTTYLLNLAKIGQLNPKSVLMTNGAAILIPRGAYAELKAAYYAFYSEG